MDKQPHPVILRGPGGLAAMAVIALFWQLIFIVYAIVLIGVPCWCIGRLAVRARRKRMIANGEPVPPPPSPLRKKVQAIISIFMIALWCFMLITFIIYYPEFYSM